jgi:hypothetical protein
MLLGLAAIVLVAMTGTATATPLLVYDSNFSYVDPVNNANAPVQAHPTDIPTDFSYYDDQGNWKDVNDYYGNDVTAGHGWQQVVPGDGSVDATGWAPTAAAFPGAPANGLHVLASDYANLNATMGAGLSSDATNVAVAQNLSFDNPVLGTLQPGLTYTVTISFGAAIGQSFGSVHYGFGDITALTAPAMPEVDSLPGAGDGNLVDVSASFNADDQIGVNGQQVGDQLAVFIYMAASDANCDTVATNVRVDVTPEPSSLVLLAAGAVSLLAYAWRKRK